jgi:hypothetical protein
VRNENCAVAGLLSKEKSTNTNRKYLNIVKSCTQLCALHCVLRSYSAVEQGNEYKFQKKVSEYRKIKYSVHLSAMNTAQLQRS